MPVVGGVEACEASHGSKWRKHLSPAQSKLFSRNKLVVEAMKSKSNAESKPMEMVVEEWEEVFKQAKKSIAKMVTILQESGAIPKKKARGKAACSN